MFFQNNAVRRIMMVAYRAYTRSLLLSDGPVIFVNSIPKSGTHLLIGLLQCIPGLMHSGLHIATWQVNARNSGNREHGNQVFEGDVVRFSRLVGSVNRGQFFSAHLPFDEALLSELFDRDVKVIELIRDPRDVVVSQLHYITNLRRHYLHDYLVSGYSNANERLSALIEGFDYRHDGQLVRRANCGELLDAYSGWRRAPSVFQLKFEDLSISEEGGEPVQAEKIGDLLKFLGFDGEAVDVQDLLMKGRERNKFTLRAGRSGGWRSEFNSGHVERFKHVAGRHLIEMGYELDDDWR